MLSSLEEEGEEEKEEEENMESSIFAESLSNNLYVKTSAFSSMLTYRARSAHMVEYVARDLPSCSRNIRAMESSSCIRRFIVTSSSI